MRQIILGIAVVVMAFTLRQTWMVWTQGIAGAVLLTIGILKVTRKCPSCGYRTKHDPNCREMLCP